MQVSKSLKKPDFFLFVDLQIRCTKYLNAKKCLDILNTPIAAIQKLKCTWSLGPDPSFQPLVPTFSRGGTTRRRLLQKTGKQAEKRAIKKQVRNTQPRSLNSCNYRRFKTYSCSSHQRFPIEKALFLPRRQLPLQALLLVCPLACNPTWKLVHSNDRVRVTTFKICKWFILVILQR